MEKHVEASIHDKYVVSAGGLHTTYSILKMAQREWETKARLIQPTTKE